MNYHLMLLITTLLWLPAVYSETLVEAGAAIQVTDAPADQAIKNRLSEILNVIESYQDVEITVEAGVVSLSGSVASARAGRDLVALASRVEALSMCRIDSTSKWISPLACNPLRKKSRK